MVNQPDFRNFKIASKEVLNNYSTNLTEKQWQVIKKIVDSQERVQKHLLAEILKAIFMTI